MLITTQTKTPEFIVEVSYSNHPMTREEWQKQAEDNYFNTITIYSTNKEYLEELASKLPKYVNARFSSCSSQFFDEDETRKVYYSPQWYSLFVAFSNNSKTTKGINETAIKRSKKMFELIDEMSLEEKSSSIYKYFKENLDTIKRISVYDKN